MRLNAKVDFSFATVNMTLPLPIRLLLHQILPFAVSYYYIQNMLSLILFGKFMFHGVEDKALLCLNLCSDYLNTQIQVDHIVLLWDKYWIDQQGLMEISFYTAWVFPPPYLLLSKGI